jgi:hypothetical protein
MTLLLRYWPYVLAFLGISAGAAYVTHRIDSGSYDRLQAQYSAFQLQTAHEKQADAVAAQNALQAQIQARIKQESTNAQAIADLQSKADHAAADRDFAVRLLAAARKAQSGSGSLSQTADRPATDAGAETSGDRPLIADIGDAAGECRDAISQLRAIQVELQPQL